MTSIQTATFSFLTPKRNRLERPAISQIEAWNQRFKAMCHIHVQAPMVNNWFPYFLPTSLFSDSKRSRLLFTYLLPIITCYILNEKQTRGQKLGKPITYHSSLNVDMTYCLKVMSHTDALLWSAREIASMAPPAERERHAKNLWHIRLRWTELRYKIFHILL